MRAALILLALGLAGCGKKMSNDQIINEAKKCMAAGMRAVEDNFFGETEEIRCQSWSKP
jgi:hypothetical protein